MRNRGVILGYGFFHLSRGRGSPPRSPIILGDSSRDTDDVPTVPSAWSESGNLGSRFPPCEVAIADDVRRWLCLVALAGGGGHRYRVRSWLDSGNGSDGVDQEDVWHEGRVVRSESGAIGDAGPRPRAPVPFTCLARGPRDWSMVP